MALVKPFLYKISPFDVNDLLNTTFTLGSTNSAGETNLTKVEVNIYDNASGQLVLSQEEMLTIETSTTILQTFTFNITNPSGKTIEIYNGNTYNMTVRTSLEGTTWSSASNGMVFSCYTTPTLNFTNIPDNNIIRQSTFEVVMEYAQEENEQLNYYQVFLDAYLVGESNAITVATGDILYDTQYKCTFSNLQNTVEYNADSNYSAYQFRVVGTTIGGTTFTNTSENIAVDILEVFNSTLVKLTNSQEGYVEITSEISNIQGTATPESLLTDEFDEMDLTTDGYNVSWNEGLNIAGNEYTIELWGKDFQTDNFISEMYSEDNATYIKLQWNVDETTNEAYVGMYVTANNSINVYYVESNRITNPSSDEYVYIGINKGYSLFNINIINKGVDL